MTLRLIDSRNRKAQRRREKACEYAATVLAGRPDVQVVPLAWSLAVFFEEYMRTGAAGTRKSFGPKKPVKLRQEEEA